MATKHIQPVRNNPLNLKIGDKVSITGTTTLGYDSIGVRRLYYHYSPCIAYVCGVIKKATGKYENGYSGISLDGSNDYDPPYLAVDKYHYLYECRTSITSKSFLVHPTNILQNKHGN